MTRLAGHTLAAEGAPHRLTPGRRVVRDMYRLGVGGTGRALCSCGVYSGVLTSAALRRAWHRDHKTAVMRGEVQR